MSIQTYTTEIADKIKVAEENVTKITGNELHFLQGKVYGWKNAKDCVGYALETGDLTGYLRFLQQQKKIVSKNAKLANNDKSKNTWRGYASSMKTSIELLLIHCPELK